MQRMVSSIYDLTGKAPLRGLSLIAGLLVAGCVLWDPTRFSLSSKTLSLWWGILLIWAVCSSVIHGSGFRLRTMLWQIVFNPLFAWIILLSAIICFYSA